MATVTEITGVRFSRVSKLDGIRSWSLEAGTTCPGAYNDNGAMVDVCKGCYAKFGHYRFSLVNRIRRHNRVDWQRPGWVDDMIVALDNDRYFRWFDSGDIYHPLLAVKILAVCQLTPWVKHWIPTRSYKVKSIAPTLVALNNLPNVVVRYSSDSIIGEYSAIHGSTIVSSAEHNDNEVVTCRSYETGCCSGCRACWNPDNKVIAYVAHGKPMLKLQKSLHH